MLRLIEKIRSTAAGAIIVSMGMMGNVWAEDFDRIFIFGDSLSDPGNVYALTGETTQAPWVLVPDRPYDIGGFQFSNGHIWAQRFARHLQLNRSGNAALVEPGKNGNYAFGGARVNPAMPEPNSADAQMALYLGDHGVIADPDALYVIQFGGNDLRDALTSVDPVGSVSQAVAAEIGMIKQLADQGATHFLVVNAPDLGIVPVINLMGVAGPASFLSVLYNGFLEQGIQSLEANPLYAGVTFDRLDLFGIVHQIVADPAAFKLENTTAPCLMFLPPATDICDEPNKFAFWDGIHPTKIIHGIIAEQAAAIYDD